MQYKIVPTLISTHDCEIHIQLFAPTLDGIIPSDERNLLTGSVCLAEDIAQNHPNGVHLLTITTLANTQQQYSLYTDVQNDYWYLTTLNNRWLKAGQYNQLSQTLADYFRDVMQSSVVE